MQSAKKIGDKKLYYYGMAIHVATNAVAHHSFGWQDNAWRHAQHTGSYGWADNPEKFSYRYDYSKHIAYCIVRAYVAGNQASYKTFVPDDTALRNTLLNSVIFKMENITRNAKRVNSSVVSDNEAMTFFNKYNYNYTHNYGYLGYGRGLLKDVNFQGIEYFTNLQDLEIDADELSQYSELGDEGCEMALDLKLDLSKNKKIKRFFGRASSVEGLDLSQHNRLRDVYLYTVWDQNYPVQDLSKHTNLNKVHVGGNVILPKKLPQMSEFEYFGKSKCRLNVNNCKKLKKLICSYSPLPKPNFSKLKNLTYLNCSGNGWGKLNLSKNTKLKELYCNDCKLTSLRLPKNVKLSVLSCKNNKLKKLNLKKVKVKILFKKGNKKIKVYYKIIRIIPIVAGQILLYWKIMRRRIL